MQDTHYRIKLYGHTSDDPELFRKNLAAMLMMTEDEVRELLPAVPVVIVERASQQRAETLVEALKSIQALCLAEPIEEPLGDDSPAASTAAESGSEAQRVSLSTLLTDREPILEPEQKEELKSNIWLGVTCAIGAAIIVTCLVGYFLSYRDVSSMFGADARQGVDATEEVESPAQEPDEDPADQIAFLTREIERLKLSQERLEFEIADQKKVAKALGARGGKHWERWREARARLAMLRNQHREESNQLRELENQLIRLQRE